MTEIPKNIFRNKPYKGIISQVAKEYGMSHTYISNCFWRTSSNRDIEIKKRIIELMKERTPNKNDELN